VRFAAALTLKNAFTFQEASRLQEVKDKWLTQIPLDVKSTIKSLILKTLSTTDQRAGQGAAQVIAALAAIELPHNLWPELMPTLVENVSNGTPSQKQASVTAIGYLCEWSGDGDLRDVLTQHSNAILTAVVQGARKEEPNNDVRNAAITALSDAMEFVRSNFQNEGERNYIMQVVCEATQANDSRIQQGAWGCLNRIMSIYYEMMRFYMEKALFGLTIQGMNSEDEDVAKLAVEFWCTVCDQEIEIEEDNTAARNENSADLRPYFSFAKIATPEVVPVILNLLTKQEEDAVGDDEYNLPRAAYQCLQLWAICAKNAVLTPVLPFVEKNLRAPDWQNRNAAVEAFGAIVEGPTPDMLDPLIRQALPVIIGMMEDTNIMIKDSTAFALGRICSFSPDSIDPAAHLQPLIAALFNGLTAHPKIASSCCWALMALAEQFGGDPTAQQNPLTPHFEASVSALLQTTERNEIDNTLRTAAYEVLGTFVAHAANDSLKLVADLSNVILDRLEKTIPLASQVVSVEDKMVLEEMQVSLAAVIVNIVQRLDIEIKPQADRIMQVSLQLLNVVPTKSVVPEVVFSIVGALANSLEQDFIKYMEAFAPFLFKGLDNHEEPALCSMSVGLVSDITRALADKVQPWCDDFMNRLLACLSSQLLGQQFKPAVLQTFGDIAQNINGAFETYLTVVVHVLQQAASVKLSLDAPYDQQEYVISLREGIMDAWDGIIVAMTTSNKTQVLGPLVESIFAFINTVALEAARSEALCRTCMGVVGYVFSPFKG
jgi:importin subunit beta-1